MATDLLELRSRINSVLVNELTTYSSVRSCPTYVLGYGTLGIQILKGRCSYFGIRDIRIAIKASHKDYTDIRSITRVWGSAYKDLAVGVMPGAQGAIDLHVYLKQNVQHYNNLYSYLRCFFPDTINLPVAIKMWLKEIEVDLHAYAKQAYSSYMDLRSVLNQAFGDHYDIISMTRGWKPSYKDLRAFLYGVYSEEKGINGFIRAMYTFDIGTVIDLIPAVNLNVFIQHDDRVINLFSYIRCKYTFDIPAIIRCFWTNDLNSYLVPVEPFDLNCRISSLIWSDINSFINGEYFPFLDITSYIVSIPHANLMASLHGWGGMGIIYDLKCLLSAYDTKDIGSELFSIPPFDLGSTIVIDGQSVSLNAIIIPSVVYFRSVVRVALLEHVNLQSYINYTCFYTSWCSLGASMYSWQSRNLPAVIMGWRYPVDSTFVNLYSKINIETVQTQDKIVLKFFGSKPNPYSIMKIRFEVTSELADATTFDTVLIKYWGYFNKDLGAYIKCILTHSDLGATVIPEFDFNYSELPKWINPRTKEAVIDIRRLKDNVQTFVELMFSSTDTFDTDQFQYFYVDGEQKVYRIDRNKHWTLIAESYKSVDDDIVDRVAVRKKIIFRLSDYTTIDEAVRSIISRAGSLREVNIPAVISGIPRPSVDLGAIIGIPPVQRKWMKSLKGVVTCFDFRSLVSACIIGYEGSIDLSLYAHCRDRQYKNLPSLTKVFAPGYTNLRCTVKWYEGDSAFYSYLKTNLCNTLDIGSTVIGNYYKSPIANHVEFDFIDEDYVPITASGIEFNFDNEIFIDRLGYTMLEEQVKIKVSRVNIEVLKKVS